MTTMTDSKAAQVLDRLALGADEPDVHAALTHAIARLREPASEVSSGDKRLIPPVKPPAEAQAQGGGVAADGSLTYAGQRKVVEHMTCEIRDAIALLHRIQHRAEAIDCQPMHTAPPSAPVWAAVASLPKNWRESMGAADHFNIKGSYTLRRCAEELEAALAQQPAAVDGAVGTVTRVGEFEVQEHRIELDPEFDERLNNMPAGTVVHLYAAPVRDLTLKQLGEVAALAAQPGGSQ